MALRGPWGPYRSDKSQGLDCAVQILRFIRTCMVKTCQEKLKTYQSIMIENRFLIRITSIEIQSTSDELRGSEISSKNRYRYISISKSVLSTLSILNQKCYLFSAIRYISSFLQNKMYNVLILLCFLCELK